MTIANGSRHSLAYVEESVQGTTPNSPTFKPVRHTGCTLALNKSNVTSNEIRSDRQITDSRHGNFQVGGEAQTELSYGSFDDLLEALFGGTWAASATITDTTISAEAADNSFNDSGNGFLAAGFVAGMYVDVTGFTGDAANNIARGVITSVTAGKMIIGGAEGDLIVDDAAGESVTIAAASILIGGISRRYFTFERLFADIAQYLRYTGCELNTLALNVQPNAIATANFGVAGLGADPAAGSALAGATYDNPTTTSPMDSFTGTLEEAGSVISVVTQIQLQVNNGLDPLFVVGQKPAAEMSIGRFTVSGTLTAYFDSVTLLNKFVNETESDLMFETTDGANTYRWRLPRIKYNGGQPDVSGEGPVTLAMPITALYDASAGTALSVERIPAP